MPITLADVDAFAADLPGVEVGARWGNRTWMVNQNGFAWQRPLSKADLERFGEDTPPAGEILAVMVDGLDAKDAILAMALPGYFTIPHFNGYAAVLIELRLARTADVKASLRDAFDLAAVRPVKKKTTKIKKGIKKGTKTKKTNAKVTRAQPKREAAKRSRSSR